MSVSRSRRVRFIRPFGLAILLGALIGVPAAVARVDAPEAASPVVAPAAVASTRVAPASVEPAALGSGQLTVVKVTGSLSSPLGVTNAGDGSGRLFVVQQGGKVRIVKGGKVTGTFLDVGSRITQRWRTRSAWHRVPSGLRINGYVYLYYTRPGGDIRITRLTANAARTFASLTTEYHLSTSNTARTRTTTAARSAFGPDGYLYVATGDGGGAGDPLDNGQDITNELLGKVLRIDVNGTGAGTYGHYAIPADNPFVGATGDDEIWDYGLRNPWRITFDRSGGDLYIADVGQSNREEVDLEQSTDPGGNNYGWNVKEGTLCYAASSCTNPPNYVGPVAQYSHSVRLLDHGWLRLSRRRTRTCRGCTSTATTAAAASGR